jgi:hypothetical protein
MTLQDQFNRAMTNPVCRFLNEISAADTQQEALDVLSANRELLRSLTSDHRKGVLKHVNAMIDGKPVIDDDQ